MNANTDTDSDSNDDSSMSTELTPEPDFTDLDTYLDEAGADGYLVDADGSSSTQRYLSGFDAPDPFITIYTPEKQHFWFPRLSMAEHRQKAEQIVCRGSQIMIIGQL